LIVLGLNHICTELEALKANNAGTLPYGAVAQIVKERHKVCPWITTTKVHNHLKKLRQLKDSHLTTSKLTTAATAIDESNPQTLSSFSTLTAESSGDNAVEMNTTSIPPSLVTLPAGPLDDNAVDSIPPPLVTTTTSTTTATPTMAPKVGGRPKGSTLAAARDMDSRVALSKKEIAEQYSVVMDNAKAQNTRAPKGALASIINTVKAKNGVPLNMAVSVHTIRTRARRKSFKLTKRGSPSPMADVEPYLVALIEQLGRMRVPITVQEGLELANSVIDGTSIRVSVDAWREKHCAGYRVAKIKKLGMGYWRGFMRRNGHLVFAKKAVKFDAKRAVWCTYPNFKQMYDMMYKEMATASIATKLETAVWLSANGQIVENESDALGLQTEYLLTRPDKLLFVDEVGSNTSQVKDGNVGGEKYLCIKGGRPQQRSATKDGHFTVLGFTAATGEPVMCAIIFAAKELDPSWVLGLDLFVPWIGEDNNDISANTGKGKRYPQGPVCNINGKIVPTFCGCHESGSITAGLLVKMLQTMDNIGVFDRSDGVSPFLILDGHGSRFDLTFLEYINTPAHHWNVAVGVPYGTSHWQVGDSTEQNGCYKMAVTKAKRELLTKKADARREYAIEKYDIVCIVNEAWEKSFARIETNRKAIAERGWGPLNYNCLTDPELQLLSTSNSNTELSGTTAIAPDVLNFNAGKSGTLTDQVVAYRNREDARNGVNLEEQARRRKETAQQAINDHKKRYTAGLHVASGQVLLGPQVVEHFRAKLNKTAEEESAKHQKRLEAYNVLLSKVQAVKDTNKTPEQWSVAQLKIMVIWHKGEKDEAVPQSKQLLLTRYHATKNNGNRQPPVVSTPPAAPLTATAEGPAVAAHDGWI
jgi:hypothetical protein